MFIPGAPEYINNACILALLEQYLSKSGAHIKVLCGVSNISWDSAQVLVLASYTGSFDPNVASQSTKSSISELALIFEWLLNPSYDQIYVFSYISLFGFSLHCPFSKI